MDKKVSRYYTLKQRHKEIEQELADLRREIIAHFAEQNIAELEIGRYKLRLVLQERKEFDDNKLYDAIPDPGIWRLLSKSDNAKISSLMKLNVISEEQLKDTYSIKNITLLQIDKK